MIIEFFGFPGSGKTTICNALITSLEKENKIVIRGTFDHLDKVHRVFSKFFFSFLCLVLSPKFFFQSIHFLIKSRSIGDFLNLTYLYARYAYYKNTDKIVVFDQGLMQAYLSIASFTKSSVVYNPKLLLEQLDRLIVLELDFHSTKERLLSRTDKSSRAQKDMESLRGFYQKYESVEKQITAKLSNSQMYKLNSSQSIEQNIMRIRKRLIV